MKTIGDNVMAHAMADTYSTTDGQDFLELSHANENNAAGNLYLAALGIIRQQKSINTELVEALEGIFASRHSDRFENHGIEEWHTHECAFVRRKECDCIWKYARAALAKAKNPV